MASDDVWYCIRDTAGRWLDEFGGTDFAPLLFDSREDAEEYADSPGGNYVVVAVRLKEAPDAD